MSTPQISKMHNRVNNAKRPNRFWDDAEKHYQMSIDVVQQTEGSLLVLLQQITENPVALSRVADQRLLADNINGLTRDLDSHLSRLNEIHAKHATKSGATEGPDDAMLVLQVNGEYAEALAIYDATIRPTYVHILEQIGALDAMIAQSQPQLTPEQDPSVITDATPVTPAAN